MTFLKLIFNVTINDNTYVQRAQDEDTITTFAHLVESLTLELGHGVLLKK